MSIFFCARCQHNHDSDYEGHVVIDTNEYGDECAPSVDDVPATPAPDVEVLRVVHPVTTIADHLRLMILEIRWHQLHTGLVLQGMGQYHVNRAVNALRTEGR